MSRRPFRVILSDIGGVLGTNGWDSTLRKRVYRQFDLNPEEIEPRHRLMFDTYERGHINLQQYIGMVFLASPRKFGWEEIRDAIYAGSVPWTKNIDYIKMLRERSGLKLGLVSNEGEGITGHRIGLFGLRAVADFMVISHFTGMRKPDPEIWQLALNLAGATAEEAIYIDDRAVFAEVATGLGLTGIHYQNLPQLQQDLAAMGLGE